MFNMTQIDFYILANQDVASRLLFACRLAEKALYSQCKVGIYCNGKEEMLAIDELLWTFSEASFVPHEIYSQENSAPVVIYCDQQEPNEFDVLINISTQRPQYFSRYNRVLEIVIQDDNVLKNTRSNYKYYKDRGYKINNVDMRISPN
jgi:DNA polymerase-3 subunit chi